jgi:hypothetical protein
MPKARTRRGRIKSQAQRRKFAELLVQGKIDPEVYERWNRRAGGKKLPEHVGKKRRKKPPQKRARRTRRRH